MFATQRIKHTFPQYAICARAINLTTTIANATLSIFRLRTHADSTAIAAAEEQTDASNGHRQTDHALPANLDAFKHSFTSFHFLFLSCLERDHPAHIHLLYSSYPNLPAP